MPSLPGQELVQQNKGYKNYHPYLTERIRNLWIVEYRRWYSRIHGRTISYNSSIHWDGGIDAMGRNHTNKWSSIANFVIANELNYEQLIKSAFHYAGTRPPIPTALTSPKSIQQYYSYAKSIVEDLKVELDSQVSVLRVALDQAMTQAFPSISFLRANNNSRWYADPIDNEFMSKAALSVALDYSVPISYLLRYALIQGYDFPITENKLRPLALEQYLSNRQLYDEYWKHQIPKRIRDEADLLIAEAKCTKIK